LSFSSGVGVQFLQSPANGKQGPKSEEMSQTLLTNKKPGHLVQVHAIFKPTLTRINREKHTLRRKINGAPKKFKSWPRPLFTCHQKPNLSPETNPLKCEVDSGGKFFNIDLITSIDAARDAEIFSKGLAQH
jgi:hypothetical protein